jgi:hypothetical protein
VIDGYEVDPEQVRTAAQGFLQQQPTLTRLANAVEGADAVDTGDVGLNGEIRSLLSTFSEVLTTLSEVLGQDSQGLNQNAAAYDHAESRAGGLLDNHANQVDSLQIPSPPRQQSPAPAVSLGIANQLSVEP